MSETLIDLNNGIGDMLYNVRIYIHVCIVRETSLSDMGLTYYGRRYMSAISKT